ncbi:MAG: hypothetical protein JOY82_08760 [Streptosporangiaceae bacterium]|nr:hypothetical protein [Streptosporangiaceae bacterium]MBV9854604.1 hypothetical protein [Streptosporangiaceae bacterium]
MDWSRAVEPGECAAWPLPADPSCAGVARRLYREAVADLAMAPGLVEDGLTMVSELAANTLHTRRAGPGAGPGAGAGRPAVPGCPELWLYLRGQGAKRELVCKVFDCCPGWKHGQAPAPGGFMAAADAVSGRGLQVVHELSGGRWGHHLTRARLGGWGVRGKAVWFAQPAALTEDGVPRRRASATRASSRDFTLSGVEGLSSLSEVPLDRPFVREGSPEGRRAPGFAAGESPGQSPELSAGQAIKELESALTARGFGGRLVRAADPAADMAVLSVCGGLTVWCHAGLVWLREPRGDYGSRRQWTYADLVEVAEQTVQAYEYVGADDGDAAQDGATGCEAR